jgi:hypothetical protein
MTFQTIEAEPFPFPGTLAARKHGCICPDAQRNQGSFNNPIVLDQDCPLHGEGAHAEHQKGPRH